MKTTSVEKSNITSTVFFFGVSIILIVVASVVIIGKGLTDPKPMKFGSCTMRVEIAQTSEQKAQGLSGRTEIPKDFAMLFPFEQEQPFFWMKDMLTSIDIVWVANGEVIKIEAKVPVDDGAANYVPPKPIDWVVEVAAGQAEACGVNEGTRLDSLRS